MKKVDAGGTTYYVGGYYEVKSGVVTKYYYLGGQRVAMRANGVLYYLHGDHLGSTSLTTRQDQTVYAEQRYYPYGEQRWSSGTLPTDYRFTGQREEGGIKLYDYRARFYSPYLARFISPDTLVPDPTNFMELSRYGYCLGNPINFIDPTGHQVRFSEKNMGLSFGGGDSIYVRLPINPIGAGSSWWTLQDEMSMGRDPELNSYFTSEWGPGAGAEFSAHCDPFNVLYQPPVTEKARLDTENYKTPFKNAAERYQYQTSGMRDHKDTPVELTKQSGTTITKYPDGLTNEYVLESKWIDPNNAFYNKQMDKAGTTGLHWHVKGWGTQIDAYSQYAEQTGLSGVIVYTNSTRAVAIAMDMYGQEYPNVSFIWVPDY